MVACRGVCVVAALIAGSVTEWLALGGFAFAELEAAGLIADGVAVAAAGRSTVSVELRGGGISGGDATNSPGDPAGGGNEFVAAAAVSGAATVGLLCDALDEVGFRWAQPTKKTRTKNTLIAIRRMNSALRGLPREGRRPSRFKDLRATAGSTTEAV